jgi:hypothetical protein
MAVPAAILLYMLFGGAARKLLSALFEGRKLKFVMGLALVYSLMQVFFAVTEPGKRSAPIPSFTSKNEFRIKDIALKSDTCVASGRAVVCSIFASNQSEMDESLHWYEDVLATDDHGRVHFAKQFDSGGFPSAQISFLPHVKAILHVTFNDIDEGIGEFQNLRFRMCCASRTALDWVSGSDVIMDFRDLPIVRSVASPPIEHRSQNPQSTQVAPERLKGVPRSAEQASSASREAQPIATHNPDEGQQPRAENPAVMKGGVDPALSVTRSARPDLNELGAVPKSSGFTGLRSHQAGLAPSPASLALAIVVVGSRAGASVRDALNGFLEGPNFMFAGTLAGLERPSAAKLFDDLYTGNEELFRQITEHSGVDYVLLGKAEYDFRTQPSLNPDLVTCDLALRCRLIDRRGKIIRSGFFSGVGPGFTQLQAMENAAERVAQQVNNKILQKFPD